MKLDDDEYAVRLLAQQIEVAYYSEDSVQGPRSLDKVLKVVDLRRVGARRHLLHILYDLYITAIQEMIELANNPRRVHVHRRNQERFHQHIQLRQRVHRWLADLLDPLQSQILSLGPDEVEASKSSVNIPHVLTHLELLTEAEKQENEQESED